MNKILLYSVYIGVLLFSCNKDRRVEPDKVNLKGLLKSISIKGEGIEEHHLFEYVDSLTLKAITHTINGKLEYEYFEYRDDTLRSSKIGDTLKTYVYVGGRLTSINKNISNESNVREVTNFLYSSSGVLNRIEKRRVGDNINVYLGESAFSWSGKNISLLRERFFNGLVEETQYQYDDSIDPLTLLYSKVLRIPSYGINGLAYNNVSTLTTFFEGKRFKVEGKYLENKLPLSRILYVLGESGEDSTRSKIKEYTFEYYE